MKVTQSEDFFKILLVEIGKGTPVPKWGQVRVPIGCTHPCNLHLVWTEVASESACGLEIWVLRAYRVPMA